MEWAAAAVAERWIRLDDAWFVPLGDHSFVLAAVPIDDAVDLDELIRRLPIQLHPSDVRDILAELRLLGRVTRVIRVLSEESP